MRRDEGGWREGAARTDILKLLKSVARLLGAGRVETLYVGLACQTPDAGLTDRARARARTLGRRLVLG